jgi:hypothetical protein
MDSRKGWNHIATKKKILLVEGNDDEAFLDEIKLYPSEDYQIAKAKGKYNIKPLLETFINAKISFVIIAEDLDYISTPEQYSDNFKEYLKTKFHNHFSELRQHCFKIYNTEIRLMPLGLPNDSIVQEYKFSKYMLEDHIINLISQDNSIISYFHRRFNNNQDFFLKLNECFSILTKYKKDEYSDSCKILIGITKVIIPFPIDTANFLRIIIPKIDNKYIIQTRNILNRLNALD